MFLNKFKQVKRIKKFILFVLVVLISFSFTNSVFGWTAPTAIPPNSNVPTPLNVSATAQTKTGTLTVGGFDLSGGGNEGNVSNLNTIKGYDDLFIWGNAAETAPIYLSGSVIELYTGSTKRLEIDGSGQVGIGVTPAYTLDVGGDINLTGALRINGSPITTGYWTQSGTDIYYNTGYVGIGTTNPTVPLEIEGTGTTLLIINGNTSAGSPAIAAALELRSNIDARGRGVFMTRSDSVAEWFAGVRYQGGGYSIGYDASGGQSEYAASSKLFINTSGNVGIGTSTPDANYKLSLSGGGIKSDSTDQAAGYFSSSTGYGLLVNLGNVGIGTITPGAKLHVTNTLSGPVAIFDTTTNTKNFYITRLGGATQALSIGVDDHTAYISSVQDEDLAGSYGSMILRLGSQPNQTPNFVISDYRGGSDSTKFHIDMENGNVGIGTTNPGYKLDVTGDARLTGKLTVPTIDPQYDINGNTYGYYISDYAGGVRMNVTGKAELKKSIHVIDFDDLEEGSELWMFAQKTDLGEEMENLIVLLTPEGEKASLWYEVIHSKNQLVVHGDKDVKFSYRLSAPRYDWQDHPVLIGPAD